MASITKHTACRLKAQITIKKSGEEINARQLAIRITAFAQDYATLEKLFGAGANAADLLHAILRDIAIRGDAFLFEILLCSSPAGFDFELALAIEKNVRSGKAGLADGEILALHIRAAFWKKLLVDQLLEALDPVAA